VKTKQKEALKEQQKIARETVKEQRRLEKEEERRRVQQVGFQYIQLGFSRYVCHLYG
jgi:hypothetical protein